MTVSMASAKVILALSLIVMFRSKFAVTLVPLPTKRRFGLRVKNTVSTRHQLVRIVGIMLLMFVKLVSAQMDCVKEIF